MEKVKINAYQLFVLVFLFEMGSAIVVGLGGEAKREAWLAILLGMAGGIGLFLIYYRLYLFYPGLPLTSYLQKIIGKWPGRVIAVFYIVYFIYDAARVLRAFGELFTTTIYTFTPLFVINTLMAVLLIYAVQKGFEVIARVGELYFGIVYLLAFMGFLLIVFSGLIHLERLKPILEDGWMPVIKTFLNETITFPFGEMVVFTMLLPFLDDQKKAKLVCIGGMVLSGINITFTVIINIAVLGSDLFIRSPFPLLSTISKIQLFNFIERLDVFFMLYLMIGGFFKISILYYVGVAGTADIFQFKDQRKISFPIGIIILFTSMMISSNYAEHIEEGLRIVPIYLHWPMQIILPCLFLVIAFFRNRKKKTA